VFVGHGLTPDTRGSLIDGTIDAVITQTPRLAMLDCLAIFGNLRMGRDAAQGVERSRSEIVLRENLPA
jgi:LacI family transcriptional regulator